MRVHRFMETKVELVHFAVNGSHQVEITQGFVKRWAVCRSRISSHNWSLSSGMPRSYTSPDLLDLFPNLHKKLPAVTLPGRLRLTVSCAAS